jgi:hypothetical protein
MVEEPHATNSDSQCALKVEYVEGRFGIEHMTVQFESGNADHSCSQEPKHVV